MYFYFFTITHYFALLGCRIKQIEVCVLGEEV